MICRVEHQISLLTAVGSNQGGFVIRTVEHVDKVERTANQRHKITNGRDFFFFQPLPADAHSNQSEVPT